MITRNAILGRERELALLASWLEAVRHGSGRLVLCSGEPGIGKTRLAQEFAGIALAAGTAVAWGRCVEATGAPVFWPWRQVLRSLGVNPESALAPDHESPADRFDLLEKATTAVRNAATSAGPIVVLDDIHWADELSLLLLRHLADGLAESRLLVVATFRDVEPSETLRRVLPELARAPAVERVHLGGLGLAEVRAQLADDTADAGTVLHLTGGNPLFVQEVARAMAEGSWRPDRPPRTVLDVVGARLERVSLECRRLVQVAAVAGRDFAPAVVAAALDRPLEHCLPLLDEAVAFGLVDRPAEGGGFRFVHALTREAVEASLSTGDRARLHRSVAEAIERLFAPDLSDHLADLARHWGELAPYGEGARARVWAVQAAEEAVRRLAYEDGARLYRSAAALGPASAHDQCRLLIALARAASLAGDLHGCVDAALEATDAARATGSSELAAEAALVVEAAPDGRINAAAEQLCEEALAALGDDGSEALRARLLAQRSHLAFYDGEQDRTEPLSAAAIELARRSGDDRALEAALHARKEALPGPANRAERLRLAQEMLALAQRTASPRTAMWGRLWRIDALVEDGRVVAAADEIPALELTVEHVGGPVSSWHLDRVRAFVAQAQGRFDDAAVAGRRAYERMRPIESAPATGAYFALLGALARHIGVTDEVLDFATRSFEPPPRFRTMGRLHRAFMLARAGRLEEATVAFQQAGPIATWSLPASFVLPGLVYATLAAIDLGRTEELAFLTERLESFRGEHAAGEGVAYLGPIELALGLAAQAVGRVDQAIDDLTVAARRADHAGAPAFTAEALYHLGVALIARSRPGDVDRARRAAREADALARGLGMAAYVDRTGALLARLSGAGPAGLSPREVEVARLVAEGLTNRQIADRLVISERTAQNHVQHILTKLGFTSRSQIAAWDAARRPE